MNREIRIFTDGACEPFNPGGHGVSAWCVDGHVTEEVIDLGRFWKFGETSIRMTSNIAEYQAMGGAALWAIDKVVPHQLSKIEFMSDSQLVVRQLNGQYKCNPPHLIAMRDTILGLVALAKEWGSTWTFTWVPREQNGRADVLSKSIYNRHGIKPTERRRESSLNT